MNSKKMVAVVILASLLFSLTACGKDRVRISRNSLYVEDIILPIRQGYQFAEDIYSVTDTEAGYDIVVHLERCEDGEIIQEGRRPGNGDRLEDQSDESDGEAACH